MPIITTPELPLDVETIIPVPSDFQIAPRDLLRFSLPEGEDKPQCLQFPLDSDGYVPVGIYGTVFERRVIPIFEEHGAGSVRLSLPREQMKDQPIERPLGFRSPSCRTPFVSSLEILPDVAAPMNAAGFRWLVRVFTENELSTNEREVFKNGIQLLGGFAAARLVARKPLHHFFTDNQRGTNNP